jgi:acyl carrier protein
MAVSAQDVTQSVFAALGAFNESEHQNVVASPETVLLGSGGAVDSLGLVRLVMGVERQIEDDFGTAISLTDEKAMSQRNSPFRSMGTLIEYITASLNGAA